MSGRDIYGRSPTAAAIEDLELQVSALELKTSNQSATSGSTNFNGELTINGLPVGGGGDVEGPSSSVDSEICLFDGASGKVIKGSGLTANTVEVLPQTNDTMSLGSTSKRFENLYAQSLRDTLFILPSGGDAGISFFQANQLILTASTLNFTDKRLQYVADPTDASDAATKAYVDSKVPSGNIPTVTRTFFATGTDTRPVYEDGHVYIGWDAPGSDVEITLKPRVDIIEPDYSCHAAMGSTVQTTTLTQRNFAYDIFPNGVSAGSVLEVTLSSYNFGPAPMYRMLFHNTGNSDVTNVTVTRYDS